MMARLVPPRREPVPERKVCLLRNYWHYLNQGEGTLFLVHSIICRSSYGSLGSSIYLYYIGAPRGSWGPWTYMT